MGPRPKTPPSRRRAPSRRRRRGRGRGAARAGAAAATGPEPEPRAPAARPGGAARGAGGGGGRPRLVVESPRARTAPSAPLDKLRQRRPTPTPGDAPAAAAAAAAAVSKRATPPPPSRRPPAATRAGRAAENGQRPLMLVSCSQLVDQLLEVFNSDAPPQHRKAAIEQCFAEDGLSVSTARAGSARRRSRVKSCRVDRGGVRALTEASPSIRVFMESGDEASRSRTRRARR